MSEYFAGLNTNMDIYCNFNVEKYCLSQCSHLCATIDAVNVEIFAWNLMFGNLAVQHHRFSISMLITVAHVFNGDGN
jgi:hypothetical protein